MRRSARAQRPTVPASNPGAAGQPKGRMPAIAARGSEPRLSGRPSQTGHRNCVQQSPSPGVSGRPRRMRATGRASRSNGGPAQAAFRPGAAPNGSRFQPRRGRAAQRNACRQSPRAVPSPNCPDGPLKRAIETAYNNLQAQACPDSHGACAPPGALSLQQRPRTGGVPPGRSAQRFPLPTQARPDGVRSAAFQF